MVRVSGPPFIVLGADISALAAITHSRGTLAEDVR